jgi:hypothetical protein
MTVELLTAWLRVTFEPEWVQHRLIRWDRQTLFETFPLDLSPEQLFFLLLPVQFVKWLIRNPRLLSSAHDVDGNRWA